MTWPPRLPCASGHRELVVQSVSCTATRRRDRPLARHVCRQSGLREGPPPPVGYASMLDHSSTAKQRLWLTCLGFEVAPDATASQAEILFDNSRESKQYSQAMHPRQLEMAAAVGVNITNLQSCGELAEKLYGLLLLRAWVYSVWRDRIESDVPTYAQLGIFDTLALETARELEAAGYSESIRIFSTTGMRHGDSSIGWTQRQEGVTCTRSWSADCLRRWLDPSERGRGMGTRPRTSDESERANTGHRADGNRSRRLRGSRACGATST